METTELDKLLKFLLETLQQGKDFSVEQAPLFVRELLLWRYYEAVFFGCIGVVIFAVAWAIFLVMKRSDNCDGEEWLVAGFGSFIGFCFVAQNVYTAVQVSVAPRLVLVQMVREMLR